MIPNLKVDIIYYKTQSDFELEFNLSGYCRMRIFKSSAETPEELLNCLAKDLDRSRIILVVTDVLSEDSGVKIISDGVGLGLAPVDKETFKIQNTEEILVPNNAVPLVSKSGVYGGCIAESGVQSIIMVTDNRALRHDIMKTLVHQYIFDIAQVEAYKQRQREDKAEEAVIEEPSITHNEKPTETMTDTDTKTESSSISNSIFSAPGTNLVLNNTIDNETEDAEEDNAGEYSSKGNQGSDITLLVIVILLLLAFGILAYFFIYLPVSGGGLSLSDNGNGLAKAIEAWLFN